LLRGGECVTAADSSSYVMSSMAEMFPIAAMPPDSWKCRLLRAQIQEDQVILEVSACDNRVNRAQDTLYIPHGWAGRWNDLNFKKIKNAALQDRGK
jgi:hypothetical protein